MADAITVSGAIGAEDKIMKTAKLIILPVVCFRIKSFNNK